MNRMHLEFQTAHRLADGVIMRSRDADMDSIKPGTRRTNSARVPAGSRRMLSVAGKRQINELYFGRQSPLGAPYPKNTRI